MLIDWGTTGRITEVAPGGAVVFGLRLQRYSYRAVRSQWRGLPTGRPVAAARDGRVWASWNGATEVRRWRVLAGRSPSRLRPAGAPRRFTGLETSMSAPAAARYVAVEALGARGAVLGRSTPERVRR